MAHATRKMSLTVEGRLCYQHALSLLRDMDQLESTLHESSQTPRGLLRVDMPGIINRLYVAPALPAFLQSYPDVRLHVTAGDRMIDMVEEGVDVLIRIGALEDSGLVARTLCKTTLLCCASPAFLERHGQPSTPEQLSRFPCLSFLYPRSRQVRPWQFQSEGKPYSWTPQSAVVMDHVDGLIEAAEAGCGIVQQLSVSLEEPIRSGALVPILMPWVASGPDVSVLYQRRHQRAARVQVFVDFLILLFLP